MSAVLTAPAPSVQLRAPFPWFGGKSRVSSIVWDRFGDVVNYVEPFAGSLAVLLGRPAGAGKNETVNDKDAFLANFWRCLSHDPEALAYFADWPVNEADLHARHRWLVKQSYFQERMRHDPDYFDARIAGWWVWGISQWIGSGWCVKPEWTGRVKKGRVSGINGEGWNTSEWAKRPSLESGDRGVHKKLPYIDKAGRGVHRAAVGDDVWLTKPHTSGDSGASGMGIHAGYASNLLDYFNALANRLRRVRVCCGEWDRITGPSCTTKIGVTAVFLDPPYDLREVRSKASGSDGAAPTDNIYTDHDHDLSARVQEWALEHENDPLMRIALCGYEGEHKMPSSWRCIAWKANGGYGNQALGKGKVNAGRERIWFSPHCLSSGLFEERTA